MHEMALCEGIVGIVEDAAAKQAFKRVKTIVVEVGALSHVAPEALEFCFEAVSRGTIAEGARMQIDRVAGAGWCFDCSRTVALPERYAPCPDCGGRHVEVTAGEEMRVREMEVD